MGKVKLHNHLGKQGTGILNLQHVDLVFAENKYFKYLEKSNLLDQFKYFLNVEKYLFIFSYLVRILRCNNIRRLLL